MADLYEAMVADFLTLNGRAFICPQYYIPHDPERQVGGSSPDFIVLDFDNRDMVIVEVSAASNLNNLFERIKNREARWFGPARERLLQSGAITAEWPTPRFLGFIRRELIATAYNEFPEQNVCFFALEEASFSYLYWDMRSRGLPRRIR